MVFLAAFIGASIGNIAGHLSKAKALRYATKPLIVPSLALYYWTASAAPAPLILAALAAGWLGDIALMVPDPGETRGPLKAGIAAFLLGHLFYIAAFLPWAWSRGPFPAWGFLCFPPFLAGIAAALRLDRSAAREMPLPVYSYIAVIGLMGLSTVFSLRALPLGNAAMLMLGAGSFMFSDTYNSYSRLVSRLPREGAIVMASYCLGQYLIIRSCLPL